MVNTHKKKMVINCSFLSLFCKLHIKYSQVVKYSPVSSNSHEKGKKIETNQTKSARFFYDCFKIFQDLHIYLDAKRVGISLK